jgi:hypothetical protein
MKANLSGVAARLAARVVEAGKKADGAEVRPMQTQARVMGRLRALVGRPKPGESRRAVQCRAPQRSEPVRFANDWGGEETYSELSELPPDLRGNIYVVRAGDKTNYFVSMIRVTDSRDGAGAPRISVGPNIDSWRGPAPMEPGARQDLEDELRRRIADGAPVCLREAFPKYKFLQRDASPASE